MVWITGLESGGRKEIEEEECRPSHSTPFQEIAPDLTRLLREGEWTKKDHELLERLRKVKSGSPAYVELVKKLVERVKSAK